jgi:dienelactone hydrolase
MTESGWGRIMTSDKVVGKRGKKILILLGVFASIAVVWTIYTYAVHIRYNGSVENVTFMTDDVTLRGWFIKPAGPDPHPAVVLLHGAGPLTGDALPVRIVTNAFLRCGVSVLTYDKRGVGESGGNFERNAYQDFVADGISAVRYLKSRSDVDDGAIGLVGSSEGGWFTPEIAHRTGDVSFIINRAGSALPKIETELWETRHELMHKGVNGEVLDESIRVRGMVWHFIVEVSAEPALAGGEKWRLIDADLATFHRRYSDSKAAWKLARMPEYDAKEFQTFVAVMGYDPQPYIGQISIPMLYIYAKDDENIPTAGSVSYLQTLKTQEGKDIDIRVIPGVKHSMMSVRGLFSCGLDPAYINVIGPWAADKASKRSD